MECQLLHNRETVIVVSTNVCLSDVGEYLQTFFPVSKQLPVIDKLAERNPSKIVSILHKYTHLYFPAHFH